MVSDFIRVKGSGPFRIEEFCALTSLDSSAAAQALQKAENDGIVTSIGDIWLAYPSQIMRPSQVWCDWAFDPKKVRRIFRLCASETTAPVLMAKLKCSQTMIRRYLIAMETAGILIARKEGTFKYYIQGTFRKLTTYQQEKAHKTGETS